MQLPVKDGVKNLHFVWDSVIYKKTANSRMPFNAADWASLGSEAAKLVKANPITDS